MMLIRRPGWRMLDRHQTCAPVVEASRRNSREITINMARPHPKSTTVPRLTFCATRVMRLLAMLVPPGQQHAFVRRQKLSELGSVPLGFGIRRGSTSRDAQAGGIGRIGHSAL